AAGPRLGRDRAHPRADRRSRRPVEGARDGRHPRARVRHGGIPMKIAELLLPEFDHEMQSTRKVLDRLPEAKYGWKPHAKSSSMGQLGAHVASLVTWANRAIEKDEHDVMPAGSAPPKPLEARSQAELPELF